MEKVVDAKSVTLGFGQVMLCKRRDGDMVGIGFERDGEEVFTIWLANEAGADALHSVASKAQSHVRHMACTGEPKMEWQAITAQEPRP